MAVALRGVQQLDEATPFRIRLDGRRSRRGFSTSIVPDPYRGISSATKDASFLRSLLNGDASPPAGRGTSVDVGAARAS